MGKRDEILRRLRLGDLRTLFRARWGPVLPDDDAGRGDLVELLYQTSLGDNSRARMAKVVEVWAPWMSPAEGEALIKRIARLPVHECKSKAEALGKRLRVTNAERERLRLWTIAPCDLSREELVEQKKARKRAQRRQRHRERGALPRSVYEANSKSRTKPWEAEGISRRNWYYRRQKQAS